MRSIIKNKKGFEMGWNEMMYLFLGLLLIVLILTPIFMKTSWGDIVKGWLPSMNTTQEDKYSEIGGKDELVENVDFAVNKWNSAYYQKMNPSTRIAASVCGFLGFGGLLGVDSSEYASAFGGVDYGNSGVGEVESVDLADNAVATAGVLASAEVVDFTGKTIGTLQKSAVEGYKLVYTGSGASRVATLSNTGEIIVGGNKVGTVTANTLLKVAAKGSVPMTVKSGKDALLVATKGGKPIVVSSTSSAFGFLAKTARVAGYAGSGISIVCDLTATVTSGYYAYEAAQQYVDAQKISDNVLENLVTSLESRTDSLVERFVLLKPLLDEAGMDSKDLALKINELQKIENGISNNYRIFSTNSDKKKTGFFSSTPITDEEWRILNDHIKRYVAKYKEIEVSFNEMDFSSAS